MSSAECLKLSKGSINTCLSNQWLQIIIFFEACFFHTNFPLPAVFWESPLQVPMREHASICSSHLIHIKGPVSKVLDAWRRCLFSQDSWMSCTQTYVTPGYYSHVRVGRVPKQRDVERNFAYFCNIWTQGFLTVDEEVWV